MRAIAAALGIGYALEHDGDVVDQQLALVRRVGAARIFMSVLLPAQFSPMRASSSPGA